MKTTTDKKTLTAFRAWAKSIGHYPVVEAVDRYLKQLKDKK